MRSRWMLMLVPALGLAPWCWSADKASDKSADDKALDAFYANRMVVSALEAETKGDFAARERLLSEAALTGAAPAAQAHLGMLDVGGKKPEWKTIDESMTAASKDENLLRYEKIRQQTPDTAEGHLALAKWCITRKLEDQARAHLSRVLDFLPDHAGVREALGFVRMGEKWLSPADIERMQQNAVAKTNSIQKHGKSLAVLIDKMKSKTPKERDAALAAFLAIRDVSAVGAVEVALNTPDLPTTKLLIEWMGLVDCAESSMVLARYSLLHPDDGMRTLAMEKLVKRPLHDFVPEMLEMLSSPITMMVQPSYDRQGRLLGYRQAFGREGMGDKDLQIVDRGFQRIMQEAPLPGSRRRITSQDAERNFAAQLEAEAQIRQQAEAEVQARQQQMQRQNELISQVNQRIAAVIAKVSGKPLTTVAKDMWSWWDEYNETEYQNYKQDRYKRSYSVSTYGIPTYSTQEPPPTPRPYRPHPECFVAGTPVVTQVGLKAIETMQPGDMVLNRDLETGALRWKPVLKATTRPPAATIEITLEEGGTQAETFRCSTGHLFWVSGKGWKKASELQLNDILHAAKTPVRISRIEPRPVAETYNLEVADAPNYFVGRHMLLTHDVTPRETNRQTFPGQDLVKQLSQTRPVRKVASTSSAAD